MLELVLPLAHLRTWCIKKAPGLTGALATGKSLIIIIDGCEYLVQFSL